LKYVLGLGGNLGDPLASLRLALSRLGWGGRSEGVRPLRISPVYESDAMLPPDPGTLESIPYLNLAVLCESELSPPALLAHVKELERVLGRRNRDRWAPREIDIDILESDGPEYESPSGDLSPLRIPHVGLLNRPFALLPLADVVPGWRVRSGRGTGLYGELALAWRRLPLQSVPFRTRRSRKRLVRLAGILNVTPDSFSDGGQFAADPTRLVSAAEKMIEEGAEILDIGAESTRPGATPLGDLEPLGNVPGSRAEPAKRAEIRAFEEEWQRLESPLRVLLRAREERAWKVKVSVDTRHVATARRALELGIDCINDVSGFGDEMAKLVGGLAGPGSERVSAVVMHSLSVPPTAHARIAPEADPLRVLREWALAKIARLAEQGLSIERIALDPGIGFGKSSEQNWEIVRRLDELHDLGCPIYVGHSRKGFLGLMSEKAAAARDLETAMVSVVLASRGAHILRVHDVGVNARALATEAGLDGSILLSSRDSL
jgi:2-amino-4-hydroxy-6-hydroxymethyldihydropteridine diphosphokinase / dihydropteroate synthase